MNYNTDGFNERTNYIHNSNDLNKSQKNSRNIDTSISKMKILENRTIIKTHNSEDLIKLSDREYKDINQFRLFNNYKSRGIKK